MGSAVSARYLQAHGQNPVILNSPADVDDLFDQLMAVGYAHNTVQLISVERPLLPSGFLAHDFLVGIDGPRGVATLRWLDNDGEFFVRGSRNDGPPGSYSIIGTEMECPPNADISIELARKAVQEFLSSVGQRPTCVDWQEVLD